MSEGRWGKECCRRISLCVGFPYLLSRSPASDRTEPAPLVSLLVPDPRLPLLSVSPSFLQKHPVPLNTKAVLYGRASHRLHSEPASLVPAGLLWSGRPPNSHNCIFVGAPFIIFARSSRFLGSSISQASTARYQLTLRVFAKMEARLCLPWRLQKRFRHYLDAESTSSRCLNGRLAFGVLASGSDIGLGSQRYRVRDRAPSRSDP